MFIHFENIKKSIRNYSLIHCSKIGILGGAERVLSCSQAAPGQPLGRLQTREAILIPFEGAQGASRGGSWSDLVKLLGALWDVMARPSRIVAQTSSKSRLRASCGRPGCPQGVLGAPWGPTRASSVGLAPREEALRHVGKL